jgi:PKD repeat protein
MWLLGVVVLGVMAAVPAAAWASVPPSVFWANYNNGTISRASLDGSGGGLVSTSGVPSHDNADGVAIDSASGRIYWANRSQNAINYANLDGSGGGGTLNTSGATVAGPSGVAIDASTGRIYWANTGASRISYARLDGSGGGGDLDTTGATDSGAEGVTIDRSANRIYWANTSGSHGISYAHLDGSGSGGDLNTTGATVSAPVDPSVDPASGKIYWTNYGASKVSFASTDGSGGGDLNTTGATVSSPSGAAVDPAHNRVYWTNYGSGGVSYANLDNTGSGANVNVTGASPSGPWGSPALYFGLTAAFSAAQAASSLSVAFTDSSTAVSPATITGWAWDFGDSNTSSAQNPSHTYTSAGSYTVVLTVTDSNGQTNQVSHQVTVNAPPTAAFSAAQAASSLSVAFTDSSTAVSPATITGWAWDFGDSSTVSTAQNPSHTYTSAGSYTVVLTVTDSNGQTNQVSHQVTVNAPPTAAFSAAQAASSLSVAFTDSSTAVSPATITGWSWDFGDSSTVSSAQNPSHTYTSAGSYTVVLTVTDSNGETNQIMHTVKVNALPTAAFSAAQAASSLSVAFTDSSSAVSPTTITGWSWDFGDSSTVSTAQNPSHTYTSAGSYTVKLTVTDSNGRTNQVSHQVSVTALPPTVSITAPADGASYSQGQVLSASYSCQEGTGGPGLTSIGGCTGTVPNGSPVSTSIPGSHAFVVTATSQDGQSTRKTVSYTVSAPAAKPPTVTITNPVGGAHYSRLQSVHASYRCQDGAGAPGIRSCTATVPNGAALNTSTLGQHAFTVTAISKDGQSASKTVHYTVGLPSNQFTVSHVKIHADGTLSFDLTLPGPGVIDVFESAWKNNIAVASRLLQPAPHRFVFARKHLTANHDGTIQITIHPNQRGRNLLRHNRRVWIRAWVSYTPTGGLQHDRFLHFLHITRR